MPEDISLQHTAPFEQVRAIKAGDDRVLTNLYQRNYHKVEQYVLMNNGTEEEAKDLFQEAFIAVWRNIQLDKFHPENEQSLSGYLYRIAQNKWLDHLRSATFKRTVAMNDKIAGQQQDLLSHDENEYLDKVKVYFQQLGDNCRDLLSRFYYKKESMREIAAANDWTEATARNNKYRCIEKLRSLLKSNTKNSEQ